MDTKSLTVFAVPLFRRYVVPFVILLAGCTEPQSPGSTAPSSASFARAGGEPDAIVVNPDAPGNGIATTIQEAIDRVAAGGMVLVKPGNYAEALVINKGLTLRPISGKHGPVVISPAGSHPIAVEIATSQPVTIRDLTLLFTGPNGIRGDGTVDVTVERVKVTAVNPPMGTDRLIYFVNDALTSGGRARVRVLHNVLDGGITPKSTAGGFPLTSGITLQGDVDGVIRGNFIRRAGAVCIAVFTRPASGGTFAGETNVDVVDNDMDECYSLGGAMLVQAPAAGSGVVTATGVVNIIGNTVRNTPASPLTATGITQRFAPGRIERNRVLGVVQAGAVETINGKPAGIQIGGKFSPPANAASHSIGPIVRFNDVSGNAQAGLRISDNITAVVAAECNWWGSANGPSGLGSGNGDPVVADGTAPVPVYAPFATAPIAASRKISCSSRRVRNRHPERD